VTIKNLTTSTISRIQVHALVEAAVVADYVMFNANDADIRLERQLRSILTPAIARSHLTDHHAKSVFRNELKLNRIGRLVILVATREYVLVQWAAWVNVIKPFKFQSTYDEHSNFRNMIHEAAGITMASIISSQSLSSVPDPISGILFRLTV
jgi:hypothetical protein